MFIGQDSNSCNENYLDVPEAFSRFLVEPFFITRGFDRNLMVFPADVYETLVKKMMSLNIADPLVRSVQRMLIGSAVRVEIDETGFFSLSLKLKEFAGLDNEVVWVGQGKYLEVWSQANWDRQEQMMLDVEDGKRFASLNLSVFE